MQSPQLVVAARPSNFSVPNIAPNLKGANKLAGVAKGMAGLMPVMNQIYKDRKAVKDNQEYLTGQAERISLGEMTDEEWTKYTTDNDIDANTQRGRGFNYQSGLAEAQRMKRNIYDQIEANPEAYVTDTAIDALFAANLGRLEGEENPDFIAAFSQVMVPGEAALREKIRKDQFTIAREKLTSNHLEATRGGYLDAVSTEEPVSIEEFNQIRAQHRAIGKQSGLNAQELIQADLIAAAEVGKIRPEFLGIGTNGYGMFEEPYKDAETGEMVPGLINNPKYHDKIVQLKGQVERALDDESNAASQAELYQLDKIAYGMIQEEDWVGLEQHVEKQVLETGKYNNSHAQSMLTKMREAQEEAKLNYQARQFIASDTPHASRTINNPKVTDKRMQDQFDEMTRGSMEGAGEDLGRQAEVFARTLDVANEKGFVPTPYVEAMQAGTPANPAVFMNAYSLFTQADALDPKATQAWIGDDRYYELSMFRKIAKHEGQAVALSSMKELSGAEGQKRMREFYDPTRSKENRARLTSQLSTLEGSGLFWDDTVSLQNLGYAKRQIIEEARYIYARTGADDATALELARDSFMKQHTFYETPTPTKDGQATGVYVYTGKLPLPKNFKQQVSVYSKTLISDPGFKDYYGTDHVYLVPPQDNPGSHDWVVVNGETGIPVRTGNPPRPLTKNIRELKDEYEGRKDTVRKMKLEEAQGPKDTAQGYDLRNKEREQRYKDMLN